MQIPLTCGALTFWPLSGIRKQRNRSPTPEMPTTAANVANRVLILSLWSRRSWTCSPYISHFLCPRWGYGMFLVQFPDINIIRKLSYQ